MKTIKIQHFKEPDKNSSFTNRKKYRVTLGNDYSEHFSDKRKLSAFFNETNKYLNATLQQLNLYYIDTIVLYRSSWIYLDDDKRASTQSIANVNIESINKTFNSITPRSRSVNGNYLVWQFFNRIIIDLVEILESLEPFLSYRQHHDKLTKTRMILSDLYRLKKELNTYPQTEENLKKKLKAVLS